MPNNNFLAIKFATRLRSRQSLARVSKAKLWLVIYCVSAINVSYFITLTTRLTDWDHLYFVLRSGTTEQQRLLRDTRNNVGYWSTIRPRVAGSITMDRAGRISLYRRRKCHGKRGSSLIHFKDSN